MTALWCAGKFFARHLFPNGVVRARRTLAAATVVLGLISCQQLIGLGDEPELSNQDAGTPEGGPEYACGIPPPPGPICRGCLEDACCDQMIACGEDPVCNDSLSCMQLCFDLDCINACLQEADNDTLSAFFQCNLRSCASACALHDDCLQLAENCCGNVSEMVRAGCMNVAQGEDQALCRETIGVFGDTCSE